MRKVNGARDAFYNSKAWKRKREHILRRDKWIDQVLLAEGTTLEADTVHHILPIEMFPQYKLCDWNLISVNERITHRKRLHKSFSGELTKFGKSLMKQTAAANGVKMQTMTLVIGMPGSGKSTWVRQHIGSGICYELDAIASAFRLTVPHKEEPHAEARRMAAAMRSAWIIEARKRVSEIFINRTAPDIEELEEIDPDRIIYCWKRMKERPYTFDVNLYQERIDTVLDWAETNGIEVEYWPARGPFS